MNVPVPASLKLTVRSFCWLAATLSAVKHPLPTSSAEARGGRQPPTIGAGDVSLQSTWSICFSKVDLAVAQHEIAVLAHNHDVTLAALPMTVKSSSPRRGALGWGSQYAECCQQFDLDHAAGGHSRTRAGMRMGPTAKNARVTQRLMGGAQ